MKALVKYKFYFLMLLAAVLLTIGTVSSDNQTELSTGDTPQMTKKPTIMILGTTHFAKMDDDVLLPKRQREIQQSVEQLKAFNPTKIAFEIDFSKDTEINAEYQGYLKGTYQLIRSEADQIGFRLAKEMGHPKVYCVDYSRRGHPVFGSDIDINTSAFAKKHNQEHLLGSYPGDPGKVIVDENGKTWIKPEYESIVDTLIRFNQPIWSRENQRAYLHSARVGLDDQYPGANWLTHIWYARNLKIFVNVTRITESADDRILLMVGAGHIFLVQQFLEDSGDYIVESPLKYLKTENTN